MELPKNHKDSTIQDAWKAFYAMWRAKEQAAQPTYSTSSNLSAQINAPGSSSRDTGHEEDDSTGEDEPSCPGSESQSELDHKSPDAGSDSEQIQHKQTIAKEF